MSQTQWLRKLPTREARVGQKGTLTYVWARRGSRPAAVRDNRHDSAYLFGAVCPERSIGAAIIMSAANSEAMAEHLKEISLQVAPGAHAVLLVGAVTPRSVCGPRKTARPLTVLAPHKGAPWSGNPASGAGVRSTPRQTSEDLASRTPAPVAGRPA